MAKLTLKFSDRVLKEYVVGIQPVRIGRLPDNTIVIDNAAVSGHHASVSRYGDLIVLEDLHSTNGTFVNAKPVKNHVLQDGDLILVGKHTIEFDETAGDDADEERTSTADLPDLEGTVMLDTHRHRSLLASLDIPEEPRELLSIDDELDLATTTTDDQQRTAPVEEEEPETVVPDTVITATSETTASARGEASTDSDDVATTVMPEDAEQTTIAAETSEAAPARATAVAAMADRDARRDEAGGISDFDGAVERPARQEKTAVYEKTAIMTPAPAAEAAPHVDMRGLTRKVAPAGAGRVAALYVLAGRTERREYHLTAQTSVIGKADTALIKLSGWFKPKVAVAVARKGDGYSVTHLRGKTRINGERLAGRHDLQEGDVLDVCGLTLEFRWR
jgi:pSer/pThr/pTyr-binding forkhead associated (FHA) protein